MIRLFCLVFPLGVSLCLATQKLALLMHYDQRFCGQALAEYNGVLYYWPWKFIEWYFTFGDRIPLLIAETYVYFMASSLVGLGLLIVVYSKKPAISHGSAHWGNYKDIKQMELKNAEGLIIGLYDKDAMPLTYFIMKIYRFISEVKKSKQTTAKLHFDKKNYSKKLLLNEKIVALENKISELQAESINPDNENKIAQLTKMIKAKNTKLKALQKYNSLQENDFIVWLIEQLDEIIASLYRSMPHNYLRDNSNRHSLIIAPTRSGKGVGLIVPSLLDNWKESCIINDVKSENWSVTSGCRKKSGQKVIKFEPTATDGSSARWNPLDEIPIGTSEEVAIAQEITATLADYEGTGKASHWTENAADVITAVMLHLKYAHLEDSRNYPHIPNLYTVLSFLKSNIVPKLDKNGKPINNGNQYEMVGFLPTLERIQKFKHVPDTGIKIREWSNERKCYVEREFFPSDLRKIYGEAEVLSKRPNTHPIIYGIFAKILDTPENEAGSIISTATTALKQYNDPILAMNTSTSDFCINDVMNYEKPVSLYLVTPPSDVKRLSPVFKLLFDLTLMVHAKKIGEYEGGQLKRLPYQHKCLLLMDEFPALGAVPQLTSSFAYIAQYGLKAFLIAQGLPQIHKVYSKENDILMNCALQIFFSPNDNETAQYISTALGKKTVVVESVQKDTNSWLKKSTTHSAIARDLLTPDETRRLGEKEIIFQSGAAPVLTDKVKYYEDGNFLDKLIQAPSVSDVIRNNPYPLRDSLIQQGKNKEKQYKFKFNANLT